MFVPVLRADLNTKMSSGSASHENQSNQPSPKKLSQVLTKTEGAKFGIASWSLPWAIGVHGYPLPERPLGFTGLLEKAVEANAAVVQIADNLPLHELPNS